MVRYQTRSLTVWVRSFLVTIFYFSRNIESNVTQVFRGKIKWQYLILPKAWELNANFPILIRSEESKGIPRCQYGFIESTIFMCYSFVFPIIWCLQKRNIYESLSPRKVPQRGFLIIVLSGAAYILSCSKISRFCFFGFKRVTFEINVSFSRSF